MGLDIYFERRERRFNIELAPGCRHSLSVGFRALIPSQIFSDGGCAQEVQISFVCGEYQLGPYHNWELVKEISNSCLAELNTPTSFPASTDENAFLSAWQYYGTQIAHENLCRIASVQKAQELILQTV